MSELVQTDKYYAINTIYTNTMVYYVIIFISVTYTLQKETTYNGKISTAGEIIVKYQYMNYIQGKKIGIGNNHHNIKISLFTHNQLYIHACMSRP